MCLLDPVASDQICNFAFFLNSEDKSAEVLLLLIFLGGFEDPDRDDRQIVTQHLRTAGDICIKYRHGRPGLAP